MRSCTASPMGWPPPGMRVVVSCQLYQLDSMSRSTFQRARSPMGPAKEAPRPARQILERAPESLRSAGNSYSKRGVREMVRRGAASAGRGTGAWAGSVLAAGRGAVGEGGGGGVEGGSVAGWSGTEPRAARQRREDAHRMIAAPRLMRPLQP